MTVKRVGGKAKAADVQPTRVQPARTVKTKEYIEAHRLHWRGGFTSTKRATAKRAIKRTPAKKRSAAAAAATTTTKRPTRKVKVTATKRGRASKAEAKEAPVAKKAKRGRKLHVCFFILMDDC